jgi:hypothetical protein
MSEVCSPDYFFFGFFHGLRTYRRSKHSAGWSQNQQRQLRRKGKRPNL